MSAPLVVFPAGELAEAKHRWWAEAARGPWAGSCDGCSRIRDEHGRVLIVARRERARRFLCFDCFLLERPRRRAA